MKSKPLPSTQPPFTDIRILILFASHLATSPRPQKEAQVLRTAGAKVYLRGVWFNHELADEDINLARKFDVNFSCVHDVRIGSKGRFSLRVLHWFARKSFAHLRWVTSRAISPSAPELLREARRIKADLTIVHTEAGLWVGKKLLGDGYRVLVDFEDWFSQDLPLEDRTGRPLGALQSLERFLLNHAQGCHTTTQTLAMALAKDAETTRIPGVIPNCFPASDRADALNGPRDSRPDGVTSFHWFSQTIGKGRGLETLARALPALRGNWMLALRGSIRGHEEWFEQTFPAELRPRIYLLPPVPNHELLARTMSHDVGLALEQQYCPSRDLTATNKIFEYFRAGLAVIATGTKGQEEVMEGCPGAGVMVPPDDPASLASAMQRFIDDAAFLQGCRESSMVAGQTRWSWEHHAPHLLHAVHQILAQPVP